MVREKRSRDALREEIAKSNKEAKGLRLARNQKKNRRLSVKNQSIDKNGKIIKWIEKPTYSYP